MKRKYIALVLGIVALTIVAGIALAIRDAEISAVQSQDFEDELDTGTCQQNFPLAILERNTTIPSAGLTIGSDNSGDMNYCVDIHYVKDVTVLGFTVDKIQKSASVKVYGGYSLGLSGKGTVAVWRIQQPLAFMILSLHSASFNATIGNGTFHYIAYNTGHGRVDYLNGTSRFRVLIYSLHGVTHYPITDEISMDFTKAPSIICLTAGDTIDLTLRFAPPTADGFILLVFYLEPNQTSCF